MQQLLDLLKNWEAVLPFLVAFNLFMVGLHAALEKVKNLTKSNLDNMLSGYLGKFLSFLQWLIDLLVGNKKH